MVLDIFLERIKVSYKYKKENHIDILLSIFIGLFLAVLIYATGCLPFYVHQKASAMMEVYDELKEMNLSNMEDEDHETLDSYRNEKIRILIVDDKYKVVYSSGDIFSPDFIKEKIEDRINEFSEYGKVDCRGYRLRNMLTIRGKMLQNNQNFYVYIRKEIQSGQEIIRMTVNYMLVVTLIMLGGAGFLLNREKKKSQKESKQIDYQLMESQREFIANISHELKTPLAVVSSQVEMLEYMGDKIDRDYYFSSIHEELDKMSTMVGELLDFSMLDNQLDKMQTGIVNLSEMMEYLLMKYDAVFQKNSIKLEKKIEPECLTLGNQMYLERAVNNYLMNAFQHTTQGQKIRACVMKEKKKVRIEVYNDGNLIETDQLDLIWNSFYTFSRKKQDKNSDSELRNIGIGLFVVKKIIEKHKGSCGVNNLSEGVLFWMELPAYRKGEETNEK